jgi:hypothetical protein
MTVTASVRRVTIIILVYPRYVFSLHVYRIDLGRSRNRRRQNANTIFIIIIIITVRASECSVSYARIRASRSAWFTVRFVHLLFRSYARESIAKTLFKRPGAIRGTEVRTTYNQSTAFRFLLSTVDVKTNRVRGSDLGNERTRNDRLVIIRICRLLIRSRGFGSDTVRNTGSIANVRGIDTIFF